MLKEGLIFLCCTLLSINLLAQKAVITGMVSDSTEKKKLANSVVLLIRKADSLQMYQTRSNPDGYFEISNVAKGSYTLRVSYPKMSDYTQDIEITESKTYPVGQIYMELRSRVLEEVIISASKPAVRLQGDTLVFLADSFAVRTNANVQELLKRLPGVQVDNKGKIKTQGKEVKTVLVDGDEFFGDDPLLATKYLKAKAVDEIQIYDRKSNTAELTGIDDGVKAKTINIKLKENAKNGYLATIDGNASGGKYHDYGSMIGVFKHKLKAAVFGNYSNLDNESKINNSMRKLKGEEYDLIEVGDDGSSIMYSSGIDDDDDYPMTSGGLPENFTLGAHYADKFNNNRSGLKVNFRFYDNKNENIRTSNAQELLPDGKLFFSKGRVEDHSKVTGENMRGTFNYQTDSSSNLKISFGLKRNKSYTDSQATYETKGDNNLIISENDQINRGNGISDLFNGNINWSKRYKEQGKVLSIDIQPESQHGADIESSLNTTNYFDGNGLISRIEDVNLIKDNTGRQNSIGARISYAENIAPGWSMETGYSFKTISSVSNRAVFQAGGGMRRAIDSLSNNFKYVNFSNIGKMIFQYRLKNFSLSTGLEATQTTFELKNLDQATEFDRKYLNLSPRTNLFYKINNTNSLSLNYNGYTTQPSIEQLQPVRQINTPLFEVLGNPALRPSFTNSFGFSYNSYLISSDSYISGFLNYGVTNNAIVSTENVNEFNKRISSYININGNNSFSGNIYYSKGFSKLHFRMGIDLSFYRSRNIAVLNAVRNKMTSTQYNAKGTFNYYTNLIDFSYTPSASITYGTSSIGGISNGENITHNHELSGTVQLPYHIQFNSTVSMSFRPANASFGRDLNVVIWNSYLSSKILESEALELKISVTDILNQKIGYSRMVGGNLISEERFSYIPRYVLFGLTWNISGNFNRRKSAH